MYVIAGVGVLIMWVKLLDVMRMFESHMVFVAVITEIIKEIWKFLLIFIIGVLAFANCFFILDRYTTLSDQDLCGG